MFASKISILVRGEHLFKHVACRRIIFRFTHIRLILIEILIGKAKHLLNRGNRFQILFQFLRWRFWHIYGRFSGWRRELSHTDMKGRADRTWARIDNECGRFEVNVCVLPLILRTKLVLLDKCLPVWCSTKAILQSTSRGWFRSVSRWWRMAAKCRFNIYSGRN